MSTKIKQVLVMRKKFPVGPDNAAAKLRTGKYVAQGAHASMKVFFDRIIKKEPDSITISVTPEMLDWIEGKFTKITTCVETEEELIEIYEKAEAAGLPVAMIVDSGLTEFKGVPTKTAVSIGPSNAEDIDKITGHLELF